MLSAIPANPLWLDFIQPDSQTVRIKIMGDEKIHWAITEDNYTLIFNKSGYYVYATLDKNNDLIPSKYIAKDINWRGSEELEFLRTTPKNLFFSNNQKEILSSLYEIKNTEQQKAFPPNGNKKLIMILIGFTDKAFSKNQTDFNNLMNQTNYAVNGAFGSVKDWFKANSFNQLTLLTDIAGPYTASQNMAFYGANVSNNDQRPRELVTEAINLANNDVNFADYDNDNDGYVDGVYVVYAGYGEEAGGGANCIWAHAWSITPVTLDGKIINRYSCSPELSGNSGTNITNIGVICHEFSHVCGLPDFYDTDYSSSGGQSYDLETWDPMASGSWNDNGKRPPLHNAYSKIALGWQTQNILSSRQSITLPNSAENNISYRFDSKTNNDYFILENRQKLGWDYYLPHHGLLIFHVDKNWSGWTNNKINATPTHQGMDIEESDNNPSLATITADPFPGSSNITSFTDSTSPNSKSWSGSNTAKSVYNISESGNNISFDFMTPEQEVFISLLPYEETFETTFPPIGWQNLDVDNDSYYWYNGTTTGTAHNGLKCAVSASWNSTGGALNPDNWLITPKLTLPQINANQFIKLTYWISAQDINYYSENYSLMISTTNTNISSFSPLFSETLNNANWTQKSQLLTSYANQNVYLAFRHHNVSDMYYLKLDDLKIEVLNNDETLPVTLTSFTASFSESDNISIKWTTESENNLLGYLLYRNNNQNLESALEICNGIITSSNNTVSHDYSFSDSEIEVNTEYYYWLQSLNNDGTGHFFGPIKVITVPDEPENPPSVFATCLRNSYPNPFNQSTTISYELGEEDNVEIDIFNIKGQKVRSLVSKQLAPGQYECSWNGKDEYNNSCRAGVYFYSMKTKNYSKIHKVILIK